MTPDRPSQVNLYQQAAEESLSLQSRFRFRCHAGLACFNQCCRTPTIILSPYDILRLKQYLGITSGEFLRRYTRLENEPLSNLPLVFVDAFRTAESACPFLGPEDCRVYAHRPAACRLFPITMGSQLTEHGVIDYYFCRRLDYCQGFDSDVEWTIESWQGNQGFAEFDQGRRAWLEILLKQGIRGPLQVAPPVRALITTIAYDLDKVRQLLSEPGFLQGHDLDDGKLTALQTDDLALLEFSYRYLQALLLSAAPD